MMERIARTSWLNYFIEGISIAIIFGLFYGILLSIVIGWELLSERFFVYFIDILKQSINKSILNAFLFICLYISQFLVLQRMFKNTKWASLMAGALSFLPFFLFWGYRINQENNIGWGKFFEQDAIFFNLKVGVGFVLLWLLVTTGLFLWSRSRVLKTSPVNIRALSVILSIILLLNVSIYSFHRLYEPEHPNVIILLIDALRADHLSCYGYSRDTTPNIDKFSKDAVMFTQAISHSTFTKTSVASLFTSRYPYQHGVYWGNNKHSSDNITSDLLGEEEITLAELLLQNGFVTLSWVHNAHLNPYLGFGQGFFEYKTFEGSWHKVSSIRRINEDFLKEIGELELGHEYNFFAYLHYADVHGPYRPRSPYDTMFGVYSSDVYSGIDFDNWGYHRAQIIEGKKNIDKNDVDQLMAYYDGQILRLDRQIGFLLEELKKAGLYDNTLIVLTADHGEAFMEHGFLFHNEPPYDELIRVPLIIKFPNSLYRGRVVESQVQLIDVMPTILDFLKIKANGKLEGLSLLNYLDKSRSKNIKINSPRYAVSEIRLDEGGLAVSVRTEKYKYIDFQDKKDELYDLRVDPREKNNIIDSKPIQAEKLGRIAQYVVSEGKKKNTQKATLDKKTIEELKALGYVQ